MTLTSIIFAAFLLLRLPIALVLGIASVVYLYTTGNEILSVTLPQRLFSGLENYGLLAIPLFMMAGEIMNTGGITTRLVAFCRAVVGHYRGGLAYVNILTNMLLASIIGSATAQIAMMSKTIVPAMEKEGYSKSFSSATTAAGGIIGPIIPPSTVFIIYAISASVSIGDMFMAGILPGVLLGLGYILLVAFIGWKQQLPASEKVGLVHMLKQFFRVLPALSVPVIIIAGILSGAFSPTESAAVACVIGFIVGAFIYREIKWRNLPKILINTCITTATITMLIAMANLFGLVLTFEQLPQTIAQWITSLTDNTVIFLLIVNVFLLIVGMFLDGIAALIILVPIFMPIIAAYGIDPVHFGIIICLNTTIGLLTPPVGAGLYIASAVGNIKLESLIRAIIPFVIVSILVLLIVSLIPAISLWIPGLM